MPEVFSEPKTWLRLGVLALIIGVFVLKTAFSLIGEQNKAAAWPATKGRIDDVEIVRASENEFYPKVAYTYSVRGRTYNGSTVWLGDPIIYSTVGKATAAVPAMGLMSEVRYDPEAPDHCTLRTDGDTRLFSTTRGRWGLGFLALGFLSFVASFFANRARQSWLSTLP